MGIRSFVILSVFALSLSFGAGFLMFRDVGDMDYKSFQVLAEPKSINETRFYIGGKGDALVNFRDGWDVVVFGYTDCPDICPNSMEVFKSGLAALEGEDVRFSLISIDPDKDRNKLKEYTQFFDPRIIGMTADKSVLEAFAKSLMTTFGIKDGTPWHSPNFYVVDPMGRLVAYAKPEALKGDRWVAELKQLMKNYKGEDAIVASKAWIRAMPPMSSMTAAYVMMENFGDSDRVIVAGSTEIADSLEFHESRVDDGMASMEEVNNLTIPKGGSLELKSGSYHIMLTGLKRSLKEGEIVSLRLSFAGGKTQEIPFTVKAF